MATPTKKEADDLDAATCAICKDLYKNPVKISCKHTFCEDCIDEHWATSRDAISCPICRKSVDGNKKMDMEMMTMMSKKKTSCVKCKKVVIFTEYRRHQKICRDGVGISTAGASGSGVVTHRTRPVGERGGQPNFYTFECPYCASRNLDREGLVAHVQRQHKEDQAKVVCPICRVMPWGNPQQCSQNFPNHLKIRHLFDYERFVDFNQDEDAALESVISLSTRQY